MRKVALLIAVAALAMPVVATAASPAKAGKWSVSVQTEIPGMPFKMPAIKTTHCLTEEEAANPQPPKDKNSKDCTVSDYKIDGNTVTWTMECPKQKMKGTGEMTYSGDAYEGQMKMNMDGQEMVQKYSGKYLGACDEKKK